MTSDDYRKFIYEYTSCPPVAWVSPAHAWWLHRETTKKPRKPNWEGAAAGAGVPPQNNDERGETSAVYRRAAQRQ